MSRTIVTRYEGKCHDCGTILAVGVQARYYGRGRLYGVDCHENTWATNTDQPILARCTQCDYAYEGDHCDNSACFDGLTVQREIHYWTSSAFILCQKLDTAASYVNAFARDLWQSYVDSGRAAVRGSQFYGSSDGLCRHEHGAGSAQADATHRLCYHGQPCKPQARILKALNRYNTTGKLPPLRRLTPTEARMNCAPSINLESVATSQHPNHVTGAHFCRECFTDQERREYSLTAGTDARHCDAYGIQTRTAVAA